MIYELCVGTIAFTDDWAVHEYSMTLPRAPIESCRSTSYIEHEHHEKAQFDRNKYSKVIHTKVLLYLLKISLEH